MSENKRYRRTQKEKTIEDQLSSDNAVDIAKALRTLSVDFLKEELRKEGEDRNTKDILEIMEKVEKYNKQILPYEVKGSIDSKEKEEKNDNDIYEILKRANNGG